MSGAHGSHALRARAQAFATSAELAARDALRLASASWVTWRDGGARAVAERVLARFTRLRAPRPKSAFPSYAERLARSEYPPLVLPNAEAPVASIVIPVHGRFAYTFLCLESIQGSVAGVPCEVILVDDASPDRTREIERDVRGLVVVRNTTNLGFVDSCNRGAAQARGRVLVFLNNDTAVQPGWLEALLEALARPGVGMVGAKLVYPDGTLQEAGGVVWRDASAWNFGRGGSPELPEVTHPRAVDYCSGACLALPRALFERLGGFDLRYRPAYYEDTDLAFRVREAGLGVWYEPRAVVVHFEGVSSGTDTGAGVKRHQLLNRERFLARWQATLTQHAEPPPQSDARFAPYLRARRHVLVIDARVPRADHDSGSLRMTRLMELFVEAGCAVTLLPADRPRSSVAAGALAARGVEVFTGPFVRSLPAHLRERGALYDLVILSRRNLAAKFLHHVRRRCPRARIVFDTVDLHFLREARQRALVGKRGGDDREEIALVAAADVTWVVSEEERRLLAEKLPGADVRVVSNVHELAPAGPGFEARRGALFIASFEHPPNLDAIRWYLEQIHPLVLAQDPRFALRVIGTDAPDWLRRWQAPGVAFVGYAPDLAPHFEAVRLSVAPLRYGAGVKGKLNTSQSFGVPSVATRIATEGMGLVHGEDVFEADDPAEFAAGVLRVHEDRLLWERLEAGCRRNLAEHFSFERARSEIERTLQELEANPRARA